jgi:hypothetical protein
MKAVGQMLALLLLVIMLMLMLMMASPRNWLSKMCSTLL